MSENMSKTRKGDREIISFSLPLSTYERLVKLCGDTLNRSAIVTIAINQYLDYMEEGYNGKKQ